MNAADIFTGAIFACGMTGVGLIVVGLVLLPVWLMQLGRDATAIEKERNHA